MGEYRILRLDEEIICTENGIEPEGQIVVLRNDTCLWLRHHKTGDDITIYFGEARKRKVATK